MVDEKMMIVWIIWLFSVEIINVRCINYDDVAKKKMRPSHIVINKEIMNISHATGSVKRQQNSFNYIIKNKFSRQFGKTQY